MTRPSEHSNAGQTQRPVDAARSEAEQRSRTLVDPEVQGGLLRKMTLHWLVFFACNAVALAIWLRLFERPDVGWGETFVETGKRFLPFFIITLALIPAFVWDTVKLTHRFAGPILRLRSTLSELRQGRTVEPLHFRTGDYWQEIADDFNAVVLSQSQTTDRGAQS